MKSALKEFVYSGVEVPAKVTALAAQLPEPVLYQASVFVFDPSDDSKDDLTHGLESGFALATSIFKLARQDGRGTPLGGGGVTAVRPDPGGPTYYIQGRPASVEKKLKDLLRDVRAGTGNKCSFLEPADNRIAGLRAELARLTTGWTPDSSVPPNYVRKDGLGTEIARVDVHFDGTQDAHQPKIVTWRASVGTSSQSGMVLVADMDGSTLTERKEVALAFARRTADHSLWEICNTIKRPE